jgi:hypothetical protein
MWSVGYAMDSLGARRDIQAAIVGELDRFRSIRKNRQQVREYLRCFPQYAIDELIPYIDATNVEAINDIAYFLIEEGRPGMLRRC